MPDVLMVFTTRLNLAFDRSPDWQGLQPTWLSLRMKLLNRLLIPSLIKQNDQNFLWLVLVHPDTPNGILEKIQTMPQARIIKTKGDIEARRKNNSSNSFITDIVKFLQYSCDANRVITCRIDSDDGIAADYGQKLVKLAGSLERKTLPVYVDFPTGCNFNMATGLGYILYRGGRSCGVAKIEEFDPEISTIYCMAHNLVPKELNCISVETSHPMWMQTTHQFHINRVGKNLPQHRLHPGNQNDTSKILELFPDPAAEEKPGNPR